ncbi:MAG: hypothetical protein ABL949_05430, partial [Fimbriimonadaceae bacterium]
MKRWESGNDPSSAGRLSAIQPGLSSEEATTMNGINQQTGQCMARGRAAALKETMSDRKFCIYVEPGLEFYDGFWSMAAVDDGLRMTLSATLDVQLELEDRAVA